MCKECDHSDLAQVNYFALLREEIAEHGWIIQYVEAGGMPYAYTVGMHDMGLPEFLVTGLDRERAIWLLDTFVKRTLAGIPPTPGNQVSLPAGARVECVEIEHPTAHMHTAVGVQGHHFSAVQLVWADGRGKWPWASGFNDGRQPQAVLGERAAQC